MTRTDLLTKLARRTNKNTTLDTATSNRLTDFLNERHQRLLTIPGAQRLRQRTLSFASVASQSTYTLANVARIHRVYETTNDRVLPEMTLDQYRLSDPDPRSGTPEAFVWRGHQPVAKQPSDGSSLYVKSTSAADTTQTVYLVAYTTSGLRHDTSAVLTGTTAVAFTSYGYTEVVKFFLSATCAGAVTLHEDSAGGTELAYIPLGQTQENYQALTLWPTPEAVATYYVDVDVRTPNFLAATDTPLLPEEFHDLLLLAALMDEYQYLDDSRYAQAAAEYKEREGQFRYYLAETAAASAMPFERPSRLGAWVASGV